MISTCKFATELFYSTFPICNFIVFSLSFLSEDPIQHTFLTASFGSFLQVTANNLLKMMMMMKKNREQTILLISLLLAIPGKGNVFSSMIPKGFFFLSSILVIKYILLYMEYGIRSCFLVGEIFCEFIPSKLSREDI